MSLKHIKARHLTSILLHFRTFLKALNLQANYYTLLACKFRSFEDLF